jgi:hypothetical protein
MNSAHETGGGGRAASMQERRGAIVLRQKWSPRLGHRSIQHTTRYTQLSSAPFKDFRR